MQIALLASVAWGVLAVGSVYPWAYWPLMWGALVTGLLGLHRARGTSGTLRNPVLISVVVLALAVMVQLIPLAPQMLDAVSPATLGFVRDYMHVPDEAVAAMAGAVNTDPAAPRPLSLQPGATLTALFLTLTLGLMVAGGAGLGVKDARRISAGLIVLGVVVAFLALAHRATANELVLWFWESRYGGIPSGPFVNRNHFAGWMVMAIAGGLGFFMAASARSMRDVEGWRERLLWLSTPEASGVVLAGLGLGVMGLSVGLTASRSGLGSLVVALLVISAGAIHTRASASMPRRRRMLMVGYVACLTFVTVIWTGLPVMAARFSSDDTTPLALGGRVDLWNDATEVIRRFPVTGTGLNTYTTVTPFFQAGVTPTSDEAHSDYLQLAAEGGLLVCIPIVVLIVVFIHQVRRRFRIGSSLTSYWIRIGAVAGLVAMAVQESVEFSLQLPGNAVLFAALCALALHDPRKE